MGAPSSLPSKASKRLGDRPAPKTLAPAANIPPFKKFRRPLAFKGWPNVSRDSLAPYERRMVNATKQKFFFAGNISHAVKLKG